MVIQCPACQTKFRIADEKVSAGGVQVRCSKCSNTFPVKREDGVPTGEMPAVTAPPTGAVTAQTPPTPPTPPATAPSFGPPTDPPAMVRAPSRPELGTERATPAGGAPAAPPPPGFGGASAPKVDPFTGRATAPMPPPPGFGASGLPPGIPDPFAAIADGAAPPGGPPSGFNPFGGAGDEESAPAFDPSVQERLKQAGGPLTSDAGDAPETSAPEMTGNSAMESGVPAAAAADAARAPMAPVSAKKEESLDIEGEKIPRGPRPADFKERQAAKKKPKAVNARSVAVDAPRDSRRAYRLLLVLFFLGAFTGAWASLTDGSFAPSQLDRARLSVLLGPPAADAAVAGLAMTTRSGNYLETAPGRPRVFVAQGVAVNAGSTPRGFLEVRGTLKGGAGEVLASTKVPCGNSFREDQLRGVNGPEDLSRLYVPLGDGGSNAKVDPGSAVPCTVVFFDAPLPEKVAEYELEVVSSQPAS